MRSLAKKIIQRLPESTRDVLSEQGRRYQDRQYVRQGFVQFQCGPYTLQAPKNHQLLSLIKTQPLRDQCVGITAKYVTAKYPEASIVDIGANIGDTAAHIATYTSNKLILVEASDYFFEILSRNAKLFPNEVILKRTMISNGGEVRGSLHFRGGTAYFEERSDGQSQLQTERLCDVADKNTRFVKTDTDGYDVKILSDSLEWISTALPAILFENQLRTDEELIAVNGLFDALKKIGYEHFLVFDDPGYLVLSTDDIGILKNLNSYLLQRSKNKFSHGLNNFDIVCFHRDDEDISRQVHEWYETQR
jgi:FkbM family methyltransferase